MGLGLTPLEQLARARADLRMGAPVALRDGEGAALVLAAEAATAERLGTLAALGPVDLALTDWRAATLKARAYDGDLARVVLPATPISTGCGRRRTLGRPRLPDEGAVRDAARRGTPGCTGRRSRLCKPAHLLPAALVLPLPRAEARRWRRRRADAGRCSRRAGGRGAAGDGGDRGGAGAAAGG